MKWIREWFKDPKSGLTRLLIGCTFVTGYLYLFVFGRVWSVTIEKIDFTFFAKGGFVAFLIYGVIKLAIVKPDPLQRGRGTFRAIRFFQAEFPSTYLLERCRRCRETEATCQNYIKDESFDHVRHWFKDFLHGDIEATDKQTVRDTFEKGYTCKFIYYFMWILVGFAILSILTLTGHLLYLCIIGKFAWDITRWDIFYVACCVLLWTVLRFANSSDEKKPTGCWHAWRQINRIHVGWLRDNETRLVEVICRKNGGGKSFRVK